MAILIIDDEESLRRSLGAYLEDTDHEVLEAENGQQGLDILLSKMEAIEAVFVDLNMPVMDGFSFIERATRVSPETPVVVLSGIGVVEEAIRAMRMGAWDFISKPIHNLEIVDHTLNKVMERSWLQKENKVYKVHLEAMVALRTKELDQARRQIMQRLSRAAEYKDNETGHHVIRVGEISALLGKLLGLPRKTQDLLRDCAPLHDVGKIGIPDAVLLKPGKLNEEEWEIMRRHCQYGCEILGPLLGKHASVKVCDDPRSPSGDDDNVYLNMARLLALYHHERWDGTGYPRGLKGEDIPIEARIVALVDVFDALRSERPYKQAFPLGKCMEIIRQGAGTQFDPQVVDAFLQYTDQVEAIFQTWKDED